MKSQQIKTILIKIPCSVAVNFCGTHDIQREMPARVNVNILNCILIFIYKRDISNRLISMPKIVKQKRKSCFNEDIQTKTLIACGLHRYEQQLVIPIIHPFTRSKYMCYAFCARCSSGGYNVDTKINEAYPPGWL